MSAMLVEDRKCVAAVGAGLEGHETSIAESRAIARDIWKKGSRPESCPNGKLGDGKGSVEALKR
jgi:hypothetical protein